MSVSSSTINTAAMEKEKKNTFNSLEMNTKISKIQLRQHIQFKRSVSEPN